MAKTIRRALKSENTFDDARALAAQHCMRLTNPSLGCYQLRWGKNWILNLYPRRHGSAPRAYHDPHHRGPFLPLPEVWTLLDVVEAAVRCLESEITDGK